MNCFDFDIYLPASLTENLNVVAPVFNPSPPDIGTFIFTDSNIPIDNYNINACGEKIK